MRRWIIVLLGCLFLGACVSQAREVPEIAYDIMRKDLKPTDWRKFVKRAQDSYETWAGDNPSGNFKRFLDDRLLQVALGVPSGEIKTLKKFICWLSLYREFGEPAPSYIRDIAEENKKDLDSLLEDFSWERASELVKKKKKDYDGKEKSRQKLGVSEPAKARS